MGNESVGQELIEGTLALRRLLRQLRQAIDEVTPSIRSEAHGDCDSVGFYFTRDEQYRQEFWCGMIYGEPQHLVFQYTQAMRSRMGAVVGDEDVGKYPWHPQIEDGLKRHWRILPFEERQYFSLDASEQIREIKEFIQACRVPTISSEG